MRHDRDPYRDHQYVPDTFWLVVAALLFAACGLVWLIGQVAAILFGPHHQHLPVRLVDMLGVLLRLPGTWDDPAKAWPPSSQPLLPGPVGMYAAAVLTFWIPALLYGLLIRLLSPRARRQRRQRGAKWASWWQLRRLLVLGPRRGRIILGRRDRISDRLLGRLYLAVEQCHSVLAFGPPGSFKTHGLVIPAILEWQGNLVTTSIKPDVLRATCAHRANLGAVERFGRLDTLVNNAGLMLLGPVVGADAQEWDRMIAINVQGLLSTTRAALPHLLQAAQEGPRRVADIVNISSIAGRVAWNGYSVYSFTKFGVRGFTESLRQEVTQRHLRVGVLEPGGVATELGSHNRPEVRNQMIDPFYAQTEVLAPEDIADGVASMVTRPRHTAIGELWIMPTDQV